MFRKFKYEVLLYMLPFKCIKKQKPSIETIIASLYIYIQRERVIFFSGSRIRLMVKRCVVQEIACQLSVTRMTPLALIQIQLMFRDQCLIQGKVVHSIIIPLHLHFVFYCYSKIKITVLQRFFYLPYNQDNTITQLIGLSNDL